VNGAGGNQTCYAAHAGSRRTYRKTSTNKSRRRSIHRLPRRAKSIQWPSSFGEHWRAGRQGRSRTAACRLTSTIPIVLRLGPHHQRAFSLSVGRSPARPSVHAKAPAQCPLPPRAPAHQRALTSVNRPIRFKVGLGARQFQVAQFTLAQSIADCCRPPPRAFGHRNRCAGSVPAGSCFVSVVHTVKASSSPLIILPLLIGAAWPAAWAGPPCSPALSFGGAR